MEKFKRSSYKTFIKWSWSYMIISVVAIVVISVCANLYSKTLKEELEYINAVQLEIIQIEMDQNVKHLRDFSSAANLNNTVTKLRRMESYEDMSRYELYQLVSDFEEAAIARERATNCYLYFPVMDLLISEQHYNDSKDFFDINLKSYGFQYEAWFDIISQNYYTTQMFPLETRTGKQLLLIVKPIDSSNKRQPPVNTFMIIDLDEMLSSSKWLKDKRDWVCVFDKNSQTLVSNPPLDEEVEVQLLSKISNQVYNGDVSIRFELESSAVSYVPSQYGDWNYIVITQEHEHVDQIANLQSIVIGLSSLYLLLSILVLTYAFIRHYQPLWHSVKILHQQEGVEPINTDAYNYINQSVQQLVDINKKHKSEILRQRTAISKELLHRLLMEHNALDMIDEEILESYGIQIGKSVCCILAYHIEEMLDFSLNEMAMDSRDTTWFILRNVTEENLLKEGLNVECYQEGENNQIFLIWSDFDCDQIKERVKQALSVSSEFITTHFKIMYRTALSERHQGIGEIHQAYQEVLKVFEYQKREQGRDIISYGEINLLPIDTLLKYPIDVENRLIHSVTSGNAEDACREVRFLFDENQAGSLTAETMQFLVINIASSVNRVAGKMLKETLPISRKTLMEACKQGDSEKMQEELLRLVSNTCQIIAEINLDEKAGQKSDIYRSVKVYVDKHYSNVELSVNFIAENMEIQAAYLSRIFKEISGEKLSQYISRVRLDHAKALIMEGIRLEEIADQCGFGSQRTFLRIFKQYEGVTPTQYKSLNESGNEE